MSYVIQVVLSNARHPEYGQFTIPFPIPQDAYPKLKPEEADEVRAAVGKENSDGK